MKRLAALLAIAALLLTACAEREVYSGKLIVDGEHGVRSGETVDGELIVAGGQVKLDKNSRITGSLFMLGGIVEANGAVAGDVYLFGGSLSLGPQAVIGGNLNAGGGTLNQSPSAQVSGTINTASALPSLERSPTVADQIAWFTVETLILVVLAGLAARFASKSTTRVARAVAEHPVVMGAMGTLAGIVALVLLVVMAFTIILIPVTMLGLVLLAVTVAYGWIAIGLTLGRLLVRRLNWNLPLPLVASLGTLLLMMLINGMEFVPFAGGIFALLTAGVGVGAVLLTRFGLRAYVPAEELVEPLSS